jgi:hypothetical protein
MSDAPDSGRDPAAARYAVLQLARLSGALLALGGALVLSGNVSWLPQLPDAVGYALLVTGVADFFAVPVLLARRWKRNP